MSTNPNIKIKTEILKSFRKTTKITQDSLAQEVGVNLRSIKKIESTGKTSLETATKIAEVLNITLETLTGEEKPILENFWLQTAYGNNKYDEPGTLYQQHHSMLSEIQKQVTHRLCIIREGDIETTAKVSADNVMTTLVFTSTNEDMGQLSYKYSKVSIRPDEGIFTSKLTGLEEEINNFDIKRLLSDTTNSYQFNNEDIGTDAYLKISIFTRNILRNSTTGEFPRFKEIDQKTFQNFDDCSYIINKIIDNYNPAYCYRADYSGNSVQFTCTQNNGEEAVIKLARLYQNSEGQEEDAPFPETWKSFCNQDHKHNPDQKNSELIPLSEFNERSYSTSLAPL